jgi:hypothetical protein
MGKIFRNKNMIPFDRTAILDDRLSMSARGVFATLVASDDETFSDKFFHDNKAALNELIRCGYLNESFVNAVRSVDVYDTPQRKRRKRKGVDGYVMILQDALGVKWDTKFLCVHHIDHNHSNDDLHNLLLIPKRLHNKYHMLYNICADKCDYFLAKGLAPIESGVIDSIKALCDVRRDMERLDFMQHFIIQQRKEDANFNAAEYINRYYPEICNKYLKL